MVVSNMAVWIYQQTNLENGRKEMWQNSCWDCNASAVMHSCRVKEPLPFDSFFGNFIEKANGRGFTDPWLQGLWNTTCCHY